MAAVSFAARKRAGDEHRQWKKKTECIPNDTVVARALEGAYICPSQLRASADGEQEDSLRWLSADAYPCVQGTEPGAGHGAEAAKPLLPRSLVQPGR